MILDGNIDEKGDKFVGLLQVRDGIALFTATAVQLSNGELAGALMVGTYLDRLVVDLKTRALADIILLDKSGNFLSTTFLSGTKISDGWGFSCQINLLFLQKQPAAIY
jgi:hypothetical protein